MSEWRIRLVYTSPPLTSNQRMHWSEKGRVTKQVRNVARAVARDAGVPVLGRCEVGLIWQVTDKRRRDADNLVPTLKALCDGLVDAGVTADDTPDLMAKTMPTIVQGDKPQLILTIRELS